MPNPNQKKNKLVAIVGATAAGKTKLSIKLGNWLNSKKAKKKFGIAGAEIISADSRQVYKGLDIGTDKIKKGEMRKIPHHLLDVAFPKRKFTVNQYQKLALKAISQIHQRKKLPLLVGGSGFYIQSVLDAIKIPEVKPDWKLRLKLGKKTNNELFSMLKNLDPRRAAFVEKDNKRRLIRALEIVIKTKRPVPYLKKGKPKFDLLLIGVKKSPKELAKLIQKRLKKRLPAIIKEVKKLRQAGISWQRLEELGLEYRQAARFLQNKIAWAEMQSQLQKETTKFAKRQMTWFKKDQRIKWIENYKKTKGQITEFLLQ